MGKRHWHFHFRLDPGGRGLVWGSEEGNKRDNPIRDSTQRGGIDGDPTQGKRKGNLIQENLQPHGPTNPSPSCPKKQKQLTSNIQCTLWNQRHKFTNLLIDIIPPSSLNHILLHHFSFARRACLSPTTTCCPC